MFLTETWQRSMEHGPLIELCPLDCCFICTPRTSGRGGGLAVVYRNCFLSLTVSTGDFSSFEVQMTKVGRSNPFYCILSYRPSGFNSSFMAEFSEFLSSIIRLDRVIMVGDFNIHVDDVSCSFAADFLNIIESFNFIQHVSGPTHIRGRTLDLVFTLGLNIDCICSEELHVTDHQCVLFNLSFNLDSQPSKRAKCSRVLNHL